MNEKIAQIIQEQRNFFKTNETKKIEFRIRSLNKLKRLITDNEKEIIDSLALDLKKPEFESYTSEIAVLLKEINFALKNIKKWTKPQKVKTPFIFFPAKSRFCFEPYGIALIIGTWNFPIQLLLAPLIGAIAAGNCAILKPSEIATNCSKLITELIPKYFDSTYIAAIEGDAQIAQELLNNKFDYIFFTGSIKVGKIVMEAAAENLTPLTLELGGKSPCIVDTNINLKTAVKRIIWGKFFNAGQSCVAPDYILIDSKIKNDFLDYAVKTIKEFYEQNPDQSTSYAKIINQKHLSRLTNLLNEGRIITGGNVDLDKNYLAPTIIDEIKSTDKIMQEEIFGPILPIVSYNSIDEAIKVINKNPTPLAVYIFSKNKNFINTILNNTQSGGVVVNDTLIHTIITNLPFGGVGNSGFGEYHGKNSFTTFSYKRTIVKKTFSFDLSLKYPPYKNNLIKIKKLLKYFF